MTEVRKIAGNTLAQTVGKIITIAVGLIAFGLITRQLGQEGFGYYTTVYAFLTVFAILIDLGLQLTATKLISDPKNDEGVILSNALTIRLLASVVFLSLAALVVWAFPYNNLIKLGVVVAASGFIFTSLTATLTGLFQKHLAMPKAVLADVLSKIIYLSCLLLVINLGYGLIGIIIATVIDSFFSFAILFYFARRYTKLGLSFNWLVWQKILLATWPIALTIALNLIYFKGDLVIMSLLRSQAEVGLYGAPYKILEVLINVIYLFLGLILPLLASAVASNNFGRLKKIIQAVFDFLIILSVPLIIGGWFLGRPMMIFMAGPDFAISGDLIKILLLATVIIFLAALFGYVIIALDKQKQMIKFYAINAIISIIAYLIFIPIYSYWAAAWITVLSELFILLNAFLVVKKTITFQPHLNLLGKVILASLIMAIPLTAWPQLPFLTLLILGVAVYFVVLYLIRGLDRQLIAEIIAIKNK